MAQGFFIILITLPAQLKTLAVFFSQTEELYKATTRAFSMDSLDWSNFKRYAWPVVTSGIALVFGELLTRGMSQYQMEREEDDFVYKFIFGAAILSCSVLHRITDNRLAPHPWTLTQGVE